MMVSFYGALEDFSKFLLSIRENVPNLCVGRVRLKLEFGQLDLF
jgi:hypothetical protein